MSDTPRTDAECGDIIGDAYLKRLPVHGDYVPVDLARSLERELNAAQARVKELEEALSCVVPVCEHLNHDRKHYHTASKPCPAEALVRKAKEKP